MTRKLFEISEDLLTLSDLLEEQEGDVTETEAAFDTWFAELGSERDEKLDGYAWLISSLESDAEALKSEIERLRARKSAFENKAKSLKYRLEAFLKIQGIEKIQTTRHTFALQKPGGKPKVELGFYFQDHPEELPEGLRRVKFEPDLEAIRERLEAQDPDVQCLAGFAYPEKKLRIR